MSEEVQPAEGQTQGGLLDSVAPDTDDQQAEVSNEQTISHLEADNKEDDDGPLERPDYWPENFWKEGEPDLEGIAKSWRDMRKMVSRGEHKAPADGKYDLSAFGDIGDDNPLANSVAEWSKENGLSQASFNELVGRLQASAKDLVGDDVVDIAEEKAKLGPNADAILRSTDKWAKGLVNKGILSDDLYEEFKIMAGTAKGIAVFNKIREQYDGRIPTESVPIQGMPTDEELQGMINEKYYSDPAYRQHVEKLFAMRYKE